ncbi:hypothetical protein TWF694_010369 [Orbilia ellipsospora]|uniref:Uncharacterized protein n=1 Tax=Orbilia ellipsospora TaxID=2528407 RepID=A0AAV9XAK9_9PEZI
MKISNIALALSFSTTALAAAVNVPSALLARTGSANGCNHNNCLRAVLGDGKAGEQFCKKFLWNRGYTWGDCGDYKEKCDYQLSRLITACLCVLNDDHLPQCIPRGGGCEKPNYKTQCCRYDDNYLSSEGDYNSWGHCGWKSRKCD